MNQYNKHPFEDLSKDELSEINCYEHSFSDFNRANIYTKFQVKRKNVIRRRLSMRLAIAVVAVLLMGLTVYAVSNYYYFSFMQDGKFIMIRAINDIAGEDARGLAVSNPDSTIQDSQDIVSDQEEFRFNSLEQAQEEMDMTVVLPSAMPDMILESVIGQITSYDDSDNDSDVDSSRKYKVIWATYEDEQGRILVISVHKWIDADGLTVSTTLSFENAEPYKSKSGFEYAIRMEKDEAGENTIYYAYTMAKEYEYSLSFVGFSQNEMHDIIDSTDLFIY